MSGKTIKPAAYNLNAKTWSHFQQVSHKLYCSTEVQRDINNLIDLQLQLLFAPVTSDNLSRCLRIPYTTSWASVLASYSPYKFQSVVVVGDSSLSNIAKISQGQKQAQANEPANMTAVNNRQKQQPQKKHFLAHSHSRRFPNPTFDYLSRYTQACWDFGLYIFIHMCNLY